MITRVLEHPLAKTLGPGIIFASTAIGVSHLVQSTRAGAEFGLALVGFVILANLLKYPFFEYGSRYANATGTSIIDGYKRIGRWMLVLYFAITLGSMFFITAAVTVVAGGFFENLFGITEFGIYPTVGLLVVCAAILLVGRYSALDGLIKIVGVVMLVSTILAVAIAAVQTDGIRQEATAEDVFSAGGVLFLIALMGWMPTALDLSSWNSLWTLERIKQTRYRPTMRETLIDFRIGYIITAIMAVFFIFLGAIMMHGTGKELPSGGADFAYTVVSLFTENIGQWSHIIISASAFSIMFSTIIAVFDGYSRSMRRTVELLFPRKITKERSSMTYNVLLAIIGAGAFVIIYYLGGSLTSMVDLATTISFVIAPIIAVANYKLVFGRYLEQKFRPGILLKGLSIAGIAFLSGFTIWFIMIKSGMTL